MSGPASEVFKFREWRRRERIDATAAAGVYRYARACRRASVRKNDADVAKKEREREREREYKDG